MFIHVIVNKTDQFTEFVSQGKRQTYADSGIAALAMFCVIIVFCLATMSMKQMSNQRESDYWNSIVICETWRPPTSIRVVNT